MHIIKCTRQNIADTAAFYDRVTQYLENHINYPKWTHGKYPSAESTENAICDNAQYICVDNSRIVGAFILNDNPMGNYDGGDWSKPLKRGDYLVIHTLASDPDAYKRGIGKFMVRFCINTAKEQNYKALRLDVVPSNLPARKLYEGMGFRFAGEKDLERGLDDIPRFALYELNLRDSE